MLDACQRRVAGVSSAILRPHVNDARPGTLTLDLQGSNQRIFRFDGDMACFAVYFDADGELHQRRQCADLPN